MKTLTFADLVPPATDEECQRFHSAALVAYARRLAVREARLAKGPARVLRGLSVGASHVFEQYRRTPQISSMIRAVSIDTGAEFTAATERDLINGAPIGVRVTRTK